MNAPHHPIPARRSALHEFIVRFPGGCSLAACVLATGCMTPISESVWNEPINWVAKEPFQSIPESEPHGSLKIQRNSPDIHVLIDGKAAFRGTPTGNVSYLLSPGYHSVQARYRSNRQRKELADAVTISIHLDTKQAITVKADFDGRTLTLKQKTGTVR